MVDLEGGLAVKIPERTLGDMVVQSLAIKHPPEDLPRIAAHLVTEAVGILARLLGRQRECTLGFFE